MLMTGYHKNDNEDEPDTLESRSERMVREREEELCDIFRMFDKDDSGGISAEELSEVMVNFGGLDKHELDLMISEVDQDGDGQVIYIYTNAK